MRGHFVHPFDDDDFIAGNATAGLEILEDLPDVDAVVAALGGGGLLSGIGSVMRAKKPGVRVYAAEPETAAPLDLSLKRGEAVLLRRLEAVVRRRRRRQVGAADDVAAAEGPGRRLDRHAARRDRRRRCARPPIACTSSPKAPAAPRSPRRSAAGPAPEKSSPSSPAATSISRDSLNSSALTPHV